MIAKMTYGGWVTERPCATGCSFNLVRLVGWMAAAGSVFSGVGTGGQLSLEHLQRAVRDDQDATAGCGVAELEVVRNPGADLARILEVIHPAISDLAKTLGVSRQSVYNWLKGEAVATGNAARLQDLAQASDVLAHEGITVDPALLQRKFAHGKTLLQVAQAGESAREAALLLVRIHKLEAIQRERMDARFANRARTPATPDFDLPMSNDQALR